MAEQIRFLNDGSIILKSEEGIFHHKANAKSLPLTLGREEGERLFAEGNEKMNRAERRRLDRKTKIAGWVEHPSPKQLGRGSGWFGELDRIYRQGNEFVVMVRDVETDWGKVQHACMRNAKNTDIPWSEKQRIKNEIFGQEATAIEVFPQESKLVDEANMYHIWILPRDFQIPFGLK